jgi:hypothetical protein
VLGLGVGLGIVADSLEERCEVGVSGLGQVGSCGVKRRGTAADGRIHVPRAAAERS